jgi:hypothetical protein
MKIKDLQIQLDDAIDFIDALQTNVQYVAREEDRDANEVLSGRAELAYQIDEMIDNWKEKAFIEAVEE